MTFRAKPVVKRLRSHRGRAGTDGTSSPQPGLRPRRRRRGAHPARGDRRHLLRPEPRVGRQRQRPVDHQGRAACPRPDRGVATRGGDPPHQTPAGRRPADRSPGGAPGADHRAATAQLLSISLERIIDNKIQAKLADRRRITVTDADIDAELIEEATTPEHRHAWVIEVEPEVDDGAIEPTAAQVAAAKAKATRRRSPTSRAASPGTRSPRPSRPTRPRRAGRRPRLARRRGRQADEAFLDASSPPPSTARPRSSRARTASSASAGSPRSPPGESTTRTRTSSSTTASTWRSTARSSAATSSARSSRTRSSPTPQARPAARGPRDLPGQETADLPDEAVKVRHILFSPNDDPARRSPATSPRTIPSGARPRPTPTPPTPGSRPTRRSSTRSPASGATRRAPAARRHRRRPRRLRQRRQQLRRGVLEARSSTRSRPTASSSPPIKTEFGYHIVQVISHARTWPRSSAGRRGADFATLARDFSEGAEAAAAATSAGSPRASSTSG